jgi:hypothetical protein
MPFRLTPNTQLVLAKDPQGHIRYHYRHNPVIPWLNDEQRENLLRNGLVEEIDAPTAPEASPDSVEESDKPRKTASVAAWIDYGVRQGHERTELETLSRPDLIDLLS